MNIEIGTNEAGQRLDKFLRKLLKDVPLSAIFKALRKAFDTDDFENILSIFSEMEYEMQEMIVKEENILIPMVTDSFSDWHA